MGLTLEEQQWEKELRRLLNVRGNDRKSLKEVTTGYQETATSLAGKSSDPIAFQKSLGEVHAHLAVVQRWVDYSRLWEREKPKLKPIAKPIAKQNADSNADSNANSNANSNAKDSNKLEEFWLLEFLLEGRLLSAEKDLEESGGHQRATGKLDEFKQGLEKAHPHTDFSIAHAPRISEVASPDDVNKALQRKDLYQHIARHDTWGKFNLEEALNPKKSSEIDAKILLNIIESAITADRADEDWRKFQTAVQKAKMTEAGNNNNNNNNNPDTKSKSVSSPPASGPTGGYDKSRLEKQAPQAPDTEVYKVAILGAGASAAYYIANNQLDLKSTVLIGQKDPWAGERGGDDNAVVNHPHNMIDPEQKGAEPDFKRGLAKRSKFAKRVADVVNRVPNQCDGKITKVFKVKIEKDKDNDKERSYYKIETDKGVYFAQRVVSALGIGGHKRPDNIDKNVSKDEVRDMDVFMQPENLEELENKTEEYAIAVSGGNAAIDVVTAIIRSGTKAHIHWFHGSKDPQFLPGTDNDVAKKEYDEVISKVPKDKRLSVHRGYADKIVKDESGLIVTYGKDKFQVNEAVYGIGPDVDAVKNLFDESCKQPDAEGEIFDKNQHFQLQLFERDPKKVLEELRIEDENLRRELERLLSEPSLKDEELVGNPLDHKLLQGKSGSTRDLDLIGGQEARTEGRNRDGTAKDDRARYNDAVHKTLPSNVVGGDQLTPTRARIEATETSLPFSKHDFPLVTERGGVNFITSNQTVIATHIACCYPDIPPGLANYLTAQIVVARKQNTGKGKAPLPSRPDTESNHSLKDQETFQRKWMDRLGKFQMEVSKKQKVSNAN